MGGPKWVKPAHGHNKDRRVAKKTRADTDTRKKLSKDLAPPKFTKFEPERFKRRRLGLETAVNTGKPSSAAVANLKLLASRAEEDFKSKQELTAKPSDGFIIERKQGKTKDGTYRAYYKEFRKVRERAVYAPTDWSRVRKLAVLHRGAIRYLKGAFHKGWLGTREYSWGAVPCLLSCFGCWRPCMSREWQRKSIVS